MSSSELGSPCDERIFMLPALNSTKKSRVRVFSEDDARIATATSAVDRFDLINNHAESHVSGFERDSGMARNLGHNFEVGDLVWGKVKSYPWWPGFIYNETFASSSARLSKKEGFVLVAFFGDSSYRWFDPTQLIPFDANFAEKSKQLNSKSFSNAVDDAVDEASRRSALGLMCRCRNPDNFAPTSVEGYFSVQVPDYDSGIYSEAQIWKAKNDFRPSETLAFIKLLAVAPHGGDDRSCNFAKSKAIVFAFRRAVFGLHDETHAEAVGTQPLCHSNPQASPLVQPVMHFKSQKRKEKNGFGPLEILAFMKQLAIARHCVDRKSCNFVKNKAAVLALRQSVFKMHRETNVEAVGGQPLHPSNPKANPLVQHLNHPASGYFYVHVPDYDPGIYSKAQTMKEKNGFGPAETVAFIKQLAVAPYGGGLQSYSFSKNKAAVFALRQAVFKLDDGTYVKAFENQLLSSSSPQANQLIQPQCYSASGVSLNRPVVETETLGAENSSKSVKAENNVMKHKYIPNPQDEDAGSAGSAIKSKVAFEDKVQPNDSGFVSEEITFDSTHNLREKGKEFSKEKTKRFEPIAVANKRLVVMALPSLIDETSRRIHLESKTCFDVKHDGNTVLSRPRDAVETLCGQAYGAEKYEMLGTYLQRSTILLTITGLFLTVIYIFSKPILIAIGQSPRISSSAALFVYGLIPQIFAYAINFPISKFLQAQSIVLPSAYIAAATLVVHLGLSWLVVFKIGWGLVGASSVLSLSWWIVVVAQFVYIVKSEKCKKTWNGFTLEAFSGLPEFFKLSAASAVMLCLESWYFQILVLLAGLLPEPELALDSLSICTTVLGWVFMVSVGFNAAASVRVSNELGARNPKSASFSVKVVTLISFLVSVISAVVVIALRDVISYIFTEGEVVAAAVSDLCPILAFSLVLNGIQPVLSGVAVGCGWQAFVAYVNVGCYYLVGVPLGVILGFYFNFGAKGLWLGMLGGTTMQTIILMWVTFRTDWNKEVEASLQRLNEWEDKKEPLLNSVIA